MIFLTDLEGKVYLIRFKSLLKGTYERLNYIFTVLDYLLHSQFPKALINCIINLVLNISV